MRRAEGGDGEWVGADTIRRGDLLETEQGGWRMVTAVRPLPEPETVYNFTVANDHDYFVGETGFLVHNANCNCHIHHIGPQNDPRGDRIRFFLELAGIGVQGEGNLVPLSPGYHLPLHTTGNYEDLEEMIENAWDNGGAQAVKDLWGEVKCDQFNESFLPD